MKRPRVLVVDHDRTSLFLVARLLRAARYAVLTARDAEEAVRQAHRQTPDLIVTDNMTPPGGGLNALERLLMSSKTNAIPIIVLTANDGPEIELRALAAGAMRVLRKPCDPAVLLESVSQALGDSKDPVTASRGDAAVAETSTESGPRVVLVVDDDPEIRELVCEVLANAGLRTITASDGEEALALAGERRPSLIVMDIMMRTMDGYTALTLLRGQPATRHIPVIILTGQEEPIYRTLSAGVGAVAHVTKPFSPDQFTDTVRRILGEREA